MIEGEATLADKWRRYRSRALKERRLILRAALMLPVTQFGLRAFGFQRWKELIEKYSLSVSDSQQRLSAGAQREAALRAMRAVRSAELHGLTKPNCLERSMTLWWMLRREGIKGELHIGARHQAGKFEAHAWVEFDGAVLNDAPEVQQHYARFDAPIAADLAASPTKQRRNSG
ncbi:MAG TPA: lasso peptide biosynthesis B2 protein [Candidatus Acidoferrales bacterium]|nr:lasso peptide biosynthesis B2 protein [Candidatus Acidoferrales bacterium]